MEKHVIVSKNCGTGTENIELHTVTIGILPIVDDLFDTTATTDGLQVQNSCSTTLPATGQRTELGLYFVT